MNNYDTIDQQPNPSQSPMVTPPTRRSGREALLWGSLFGGGTVIIWNLADRFIILPYAWRLASQMHLTRGVVDSGLLIAYYLFFCIIYFILGIVVGIRTGKVSTALVASLWVNLWVYLTVLLFGIGSFVFAYAHDPSTARALSTNLFSIIYLITSYIANLIIALILGAALGVFGGLIGRALARGNRPTP